MICIINNTGEKVSLLSLRPARSVLGVFTEREYCIAIALLAVRGSMRGAQGHYFFPLILYHTGAETFPEFTHCFLKTKDYKLIDLKVDLGYKSFN